jgi:hypothetical protein
VNSRVRGNLAVRIWVLLILATAFVAPARADQPSAYGPELEGFEYPFTTERFSFPSQGQTVSMTFMDVAPNKPNGRTVVLLHGKNFLCRHLGSNRQNVSRGWLSRHSARPDRLLQIDQAGALSV